MAELSCSWSQPVHTVQVMVNCRVHSGVTNAFELFACRNLHVYCRPPSGLLD